MASSNRAPIQLTKEDVERIKSLPVVKLRIGGELKTGHFDETTNQFFQTN